MSENQQSDLPVAQTTQDPKTEHSHADNDDLEAGNETKPAESHDSNDANHSNHSSDNSDTPKFRHFTQSTSIELFYDLFFVANLTAFTYVHEVNDANSLTQYIGFFSILWFTWFQVSLYDVRFTMDTAFERVAKIIQLL